MNRRLVAQPIICILFTAACISCDRGDAVDTLVQAHRSRHGIPGAAVLIVKDGKILKSQGYGDADRETNARVNSETAFPIQSITKQFTATAIMMLVEEGKLALDDPIGRYLDSAPPAWERITIRHLLTHTSGIKDFINEPHLDLSRDHTEDEILQSAAGLPLNFQPGDAWAYSNTNYHLLAMIIRKVSGQWYGDFLAERIFKPLGMTRTWVVRGAENPPNMARGYVLENGQLHPGTMLPPSIAGYGGGGIRSTVLDLAKWDAALYTEQLLKRSTLDQMWTPVRLNNGTTHPYGMGWEISSVNGHRLIWHAGGWVGYSAQIGRLVDDRLTVIVLTNLRNAAPGALARTIAAQYLPEVAPPVYQPIPDNEPQITTRLGEILRRAADGALGPDDFTPGAWESASPYLQQLRTDLSALGPLERLTLVQRKTQDGQASYRYRAQFRRTSLIIHVIFTPEGKLAVFMPEPEEG